MNPQAMASVVPSELDERTLRNAFSHYTTGVVVVTCRDAEGNSVGVTVNSFTSVSLDPPLVLFCLVSRANNFSIWEGADFFAVNILSDRQEALSNAFARPTANPWRGVVSDDGRNGCPLLRGAAASMECRKYAHYPGGDHLILVGQVTAVCSDDETKPLVFSRGRYGAYWGAEFGAIPSDRSFSDLVLAGFG